MMSRKIVVSLFLVLTISATVMAAIAVSNRPLAPKPVTVSDKDQKPTSTPLQETVSATQIPSVQPTVQPTTAAPTSIITTTPVARTRYFAPSQFVELYSNTQFANTQTPQASPAITGNAPADQRITQLAVEAGYRLQPVATSGLVSVGNQQLHATASAAWNQLQLHAKTKGISLELISGYRSVEAQQDLFLGSLKEEGIARIGRHYTDSEISQGEADLAIRSILSYRSIPGYSKHHTGYVLDLTDTASGKYFTEFRTTAAYQWIAADNFAQAKNFGFIPSYPEGAGNMGPNPEAWEFVYVGIDRLR
jgi:LAS superfamily LD-carboxypeptidase LdcB